MPSRSAAQQRLMGMALAAKRGKGHFGSKIHEIAEGMSEKQIRDFAKTKHEGLPEKKSEVIEALKFKLASLNANLNTIGEIVLGHNYIPQPENGESVLDAMLHRDDNINSRNIMLNAFKNNPVVASLGGNVAEASNSLSKGLQGANISGNFGRVGPISPSEKNEAMEALVRKFHNNEASEADGNAKTSSEKLIGGKGDYKPDSGYSKKELNKGTKHEEEHTKNKGVAKEIAKDHLEERSDYYSALARAKIE